VTNLAMLIVQYIHVSGVVNYLKGEFFVYFNILIVCASICSVLMYLVVL